MPVPGGTYHSSFQAETISKNRDSPEVGLPAEWAAGQPGTQPAHSSCCPSTHRDWRPAPGEQQWRGISVAYLPPSSFATSTAEQENSALWLLSYQAANQHHQEAAAPASPVFMNLQHSPKLQFPWRAQRLLTCITPSRTHTTHFVKKSF